MKTKIFFSLVCAASMTSMGLSADRELSDYQARTYVRNETNRLMPNRTNDPSINTLKKELKRYVLENYQHGWFLLGYFYFEKELYNGILYELTRYVEEESYYHAVDKLKNHSDKFTIARKISRNIRGELDTITSQMGRQGKKLLPGHIGPFIGQCLHDKVETRLKEQGFLNQSGQKMAQDNYKKREYKGECTICLEKYSYNRQPKTLHCGHSFCHECLLNQYKAEGGKKLKCAACYQHINTEDYPEIFHPAPHGQQMAQDNYEKREYKGECAICLEKYSYSRQPKTLHCSHSFCHECLLNQYKAEGGKKLKCAACYQHINTEDYPEIFHPDPPVYSVFPDPGAGHYARYAPPAYGSDY